MNSARLFGLDVTRHTFDEAIKALSEAMMESEGRAKIVVTPNSDHLIRLDEDPSLKGLYGKAEFIYPDGFPLVLTSYLKYGKRGPTERVCGSDLFTAMLRNLNRMKGRAFIIGGQPGREDFIAAKLKELYPDLELGVFAPMFGFSYEKPDGIRAFDLVNEFKPHAVFVCLGFPKQEIWSFHYRDEMSTNLIACFGQSLEFEIGIVKRAPHFIRALWLEWLWRMAMEPRRMWYRYLVRGPKILWLMIRDLRSNDRRLT